MEEKKIVFDYGQIVEILPHRYPFLFVDKIIEFEDNKKIIGVKNVTINEPFFVGHFPGRPVMPGVLALEAMAQVAAIFAIKSTNGVLPGKTVFLTGVNNVKWRKQILPGDTLLIEMFSVKKRRPLWFMKGNVFVDGKQAVYAEISAAEVD
jgi:beta-hydroxyacyl-ACP dehydratase FabZ